MHGSTLNIALLQLATGQNLEDNWSQLIHWVSQCPKETDMIVLPEVCHFRANGSQILVSDYAQSIDGDFITNVQQLAKELSTAIVIGSFIESDLNHVYNTSVFIDEMGQILGTYRKMHLFDVTVDGHTIQESKTFTRGSVPCIVNWKGWVVGLSICYDLRFPELYRYYADYGVDIVLVPSSFTFNTGSRHWHTLCRARAIENTMYVLAPNQTGVGASGVKCFGHSLIVDYNGQILAEANSVDCSVITAVLNSKDLNEYRQSLPVLDHRHLFFNSITD